MLLTMGEILIDLTQTGVNAAGIPQYAANPGGAPANVAVAAAKLGAETGFIGCVGRDAFGDFLQATLMAQGVDVCGLSVTEEAPTTLAVVSIDESGERSFQFYRKHGADVCLCREMVDWAQVAEAEIFHFGSVSLTAEPSRSTTLEAAAYAKAHGALITYDPNYRANLWPDEESAIQAMRAPLGLVDVIKLSDEETALLTGEADPEQAALELERQGISLVLVTLGAEGVLYRHKGHSGRVTGVSVQVADTNGAGDTFFGAVLSRLQGQNVAALTEAELTDILRIANRAAAITCSRPGAIPAMPSMAEVMHFKS